MIRYRLKIIDIVDEAKGTKTFYFEKPEEFSWEEGSHTHIGLVGFDEGEKPNKNWVRHMSIMTLPSENKVGITTRMAGNSEFKLKLAQLNVGDEVILFKLGARMTLKRCNKPIVLLSMGVGSATMRPIVLAYINDRSGIPGVVNVNVDASGDFLFRDELDRLADARYANYWLNSRKAFYEKLEELAGTENAIYYVVGSDGFIKDVVQKLMARHISGEDIVIDKKDEVRHEFMCNGS